MPTPQFHREEEIIARMVAKVVVRAGLSDMTDASTVFHVIAAVARELGDINYNEFLRRDLWSVAKAAGVDLDERIREILPADRLRGGAQRATGVVVAGRNTATLSAVPVPVGQLARTATGRLVQTTQLGQIAASQTLSSNITVEAVDANDEIIGLGEVVAWVSAPAGVDTVTNVTPIAYGRTQESDEDFRTAAIRRVQSLPKRLKVALVEAVVGLTDVATNKTIRRAKVYTDPSTPGYVTLYVSDGQSTIETSTTITGENVTGGLAGPPLNSAQGGEEWLQLAQYPVRLESTFTLTSSIRGALAQGVDYYLNPTDGWIFFTPPLVQSEEIEADYTAFTGLIREAQKVITGDDNDPSNYPGVQAEGVVVRVLPVIPRTATFVLSLLLNSKQNREALEALAEQAILLYANSPETDEIVVLNRVRCAALDASGAIDVSISAPTGNIILAPNEEFRITADDVDWI